MIFFKAAFQVLRYGLNRVCGSTNPTSCLHAPPPSITSASCPNLLPIQRARLTQPHTSINDIAAALGRTDPFTLSAPKLADLSSQHGTFYPSYGNSDPSTPITSLDAPIPNIYKDAIAFRSTSEPISSMERASQSMFQLNAWNMILIVVSIFVALLIRTLLGTICSLETRLANEQAAKRRYRIANTENLKLANQSSDLKNRLIQLTDQLVVLDSEKAQLQQELIVSDDEKTQLHEELVVLDDEKAQLQQELVVLGVETAQLHEKLVVLDGEKTQLQQELVVSDGEKAQLHEKVVVLDDENTQLQEKLVMFDGEKTQLQEELGTAQANFATQSVRAEEALRCGHQTKDYATRLEAKIEVQASELQSAIKINEDMTAEYRKCSNLYQSIQVDLANERAEKDKALRRATEVETRIVNLTSELAGQANLLTATLAENSNLTGTKNDLVERVSSLEVELASAHDDISSEKCKTVKLEQQLTEKDALVQSLTAVTSRLELDLETCSRRISELTEDLVVSSEAQESMDSTRAKELEDHRCEMQALSDLVAILENDVGYRKESMTRLAEQLASKESDLLTLTGRYEQELAKFRSRIAGLDGKIVAAEVAHSMEIKSQDARLDRLNGVIANLEGRLAKQKGTDSHLQSELALETSFVCSLEPITELEEDVYDLRQQVTALEAKLLVAAEEKDRLEAYHSSEKNRLRAKIDDLRKTVHVLKDTSTRSEQKLEKMKDKANREKDLKERALVESKEHAVEAEDLRNTVDLLTDNVSSLEGDIRKQRGEKQLMNGELIRLRQSDLKQKERINTLNASADKLQASMDAEMERGHQDRMRHHQQIITLSGKLGETKAELNRKEDEISDLKTRIVQLERSAIHDPIDGRQPPRDHDSPKYTNEPSDRTSLLLEAFACNSSSPGGTPQKGRNSTTYPIPTEAKQTSLAPINNDDIPKQMPTPKLTNHSYIYKGDSTVAEMQAKTQPDETTRPTPVSMLAFLPPNASTPFPPLENRPRRSVTVLQGSLLTSDIRRPQLGKSGPATGSGRENASHLDFVIDLFSEAKRARRTPLQTSIPPPRRQDKPKTHEGPQNAALLPLGEQDLNSLSSLLKCRPSFAPDMTSNFTTKKGAQSATTALVENTPTPAHRGARRYRI